MPVSGVGRGRPLRAFSEFGGGEITVIQFEGQGKVAPQASVGRVDQEPDGVQGHVMEEPLGVPGVGSFVEARQHRQMAQRLEGRHLAGVSEIFQSRKESVVRSHRAA